MADFLEKILRCPSCKQSINNLHAKNCRLKSKIKKEQNIWSFKYNKSVKSQLINELKHQQGTWGRISDGSYEILASLARGNRTVDIACGEGWIEKLAPETVGVDYSISALKKAKKNGARYLVCASAENLPFIDDAFDISVCAGSLENINNPQKAIEEMARISKIQVMSVHREFSFPFARILRKLATKILKIEHQAVEKPLKWSELEKMLIAANLNIVFRGYWNLPVNYGQPANFLPVFSKIPSCFFVICIKNKYSI